MSPLGLVLVVILVLVLLGGLGGGVCVALLGLWLWLRQLWRWRRRIGSDHPPGPAVHPRHLSVPCSRCCVLGLKCGTTPNPWDVKTKWLTNRPSSQMNRVRRQRRLAEKPKAELPQPQLRPTYRGPRRPQTHPAKVPRAASRFSTSSVRPLPARKRSLVPATNGASQGQESRQLLAARRRKRI